MSSAAPLPDARTRILDAAQALVGAGGVAGLTLKAAARGAGVSKGGLLHHFASKEALPAGMMARLAEEGTPPGIASAAMAVKHGLMLARIFGIHEVTEVEREGLRRTMAGLPQGAP
jgi:AcrR family transcriptional regulator